MQKINRNNNVKLKCEIDEKNNVYSQCIDCGLKEGLKELLKG